MVNQQNAGRVSSAGRGPDAYSRVTSVTGSSSGPTSSGNIKVVVRVRPENEAEAQSGKGSVIRVLDEHVLIFDPKEENSPDFYHGKKRVGRDLNKKKKRDVRFAFDRVFDDSCNNEDLYNQTTKLILDGLLDGYNCSVFAYGATGAGKTFTMLGNYGSPGVMFLTMMELYKRIESVKEDKTCDVAVSYLEVYNEQIRDLLVPGKFLPIREDPNKGVIISGLSLHKPTNAEELLHMLDFGNRNRTQHPTDANAESSRSHAVFQVFVRQRDRTANISTNVRIAKMSLIDLAGSERATVTTNRGARFREGANINKSLLALGNCINALAEGKSKGFVPYRNSKLTRLLKDSLGGNCRTVMIAAVSPSFTSYEDTYNTLNYANRAKKIKADLKRNVLSVDFHISQYAKIVDELRIEVNELRAKVKSYEDGEMSATPKSEAVVPANKEETNRMKGELVVVFEDRRNIRKEVMELEGSDRDLAMKVHFKSRCLNRVQTIFTMPVCEKITDRINRGIETTRRKQQKIVLRKHRVLSRMDDNESRLTRIQSEMAALGPESMEAELLESQVRNHHLEIELIDTKRHVKHLKKICRFQESQAKNTEKLLSTVLQSYKQAYFILKGHGIATSDLTTQFEAVQQLVEGEREVAFADQTFETPAAVDESRNDTQVEVHTEEDFFDLNQILTMPVMSAVSLLTHTPKSGTPRTRRSVGSTRKVGVSMTPISCLKSSNAPTLKPWNMTKLLGMSGDACSGESLPDIQPASQSVTEPHIRPSTPPGIKVGCPSKHPSMQPPQINSELSSSQSDSSVVKPTAMLALPRTSLSCSLSPSHDVSGQSDPNNSSEIIAGASTIKENLNSTFTRELLDGVEPLVDSPDVFNTTVDLAQPTVETPSVPTVQTPSVKSNIMDTTVTLTPPLPPRAPLSDPKEAWTVDKPITPCRKVSCDPNETRELVSDFSTKLLGGTVTKTTDRSSQNANGGTITKSKPAVNSGTVTKNKDNETPPNSSQHSNVVRSMDFSDDKPPSPAGKLTFAEALKSPGRALTRSISQPAPEISRSPLQSRENIPMVNKHALSKDSESGIPRKQRKITFANADGSRRVQENNQHKARGRDPNRLTASTSSLRSRSALSRSSSNVQGSLHRMGLPSTADSQSRSGNNGGRPNYQQNTKSSAVKRAGHRRSLTSDDSQKLSHLRGPESSKGEPIKSSRSLFKSKSKSSSQLPKRGHFY